MANLTGKKVAIIATDYFEEAELISPRDELVNAGAEVHIIAPHSGEIQSLNHIDPGKSVKVDLTLDEANPDDYDAAVIPGGVVNADHLRMEQKARDFVVKVMSEENKPVAAICHGSWLLVSSHVVRGKKLTSYYTLQDDIRNSGGEWEDKELIVDDNLITSRKPDDLPAFNRAIIDALAK